MADWSNLKSSINSVIKTNGEQEITGQVLQNVLNTIVSTIGENATFAGIATPETNPGTPDGNVFYLATTAGTYSNFNGIVINSGEAVILEWKGSWTKKTSGFATEEKLSELGSELREHLFIYPGGLFPIITERTEDNLPIYNVKFKKGTYYSVDKSSGKNTVIVLDEEISFDVHPGKMLICDNITSELKVVNQTDSSVTNKTVLLNNMRLIQGQFEAILLNSIAQEQLKLANLINEQILIFSQRKTPDITFNNNNNSYKVVFKDATIYKKELRSSTAVPITTFVGKNEDERTFIVQPGEALYYFNDKFVVDSINNATIDGTSPFVLLLENSRYAEAGQLLSVLLNTLTLDFDKLRQSLPNNVESYDYASFANITNYQDDMFEYVRPIRILNFYVDEENMSDTFGLGVLNISNGVGQFYIYDIDKAYNVCGIDIQPSDGQETLKGVTRLFGNYTYKNRINIYLDCVINWDLFSKSTSTTSPTILFKPTSFIGSDEFKSKFTSGSRLKGYYEEFFSVEVSGQNQNEAIYDGVYDNYISSATTYNDMCHFVMPKHVGDAPAKLVILCHGGGKSVTENTDNWYNYQNIGKIFNALGYAVLLTNGMPRDWATEHGIDIDRQCGNWMAVQSAVKAYNYVVNKYNIDTNGCYVYGQSQGGMVAENIAELSGLPILATILESPAISMQYAQLYISSAKSYLQALYGFDSQETYDKNKCIGLDPFVRNVNPKIEVSGNSVASLDVNLTTMESKKYRVNTPVLIIRSLDDTTISPKIIGAYAQAIINAGGNCKLLTYESGSHSTIAGTSIVGTVNGLNVSSALYNILHYLSQFGGYSINDIVLS